MALDFPLDLSGVRIVRTDAEIDCADIDSALRGAGATLVLVPDSIGESALVEEVSEADLLMMCYTPITARVITGAIKLRGIVKYGVGIDAIDIDAARARGIPVVNVPDYADNTVAEAALCMTLCLLRKVLPIATAMQEQGWVNPEPQWLGRDLSSKCVALIGAGRIGRAFARMAGCGFGARVIAYDPDASRDELEVLGIEKIDDLHALLAEADVVSVHCVLNENTRRLIGAPEFGAMVRQPVFVNVSRGGIVDEMAMVQALDARQISAVGLDVFTEEPLNMQSHPLSTLFGRDNVMLVPHLAFYTVEAMQRLSEETLARCAEILSGDAVQIHSDDPRLLAQSKRVVFRR